MLSVGFLFSCVAIFAQQSVSDDVFHKQGGIEIILNDRALVSTLVKHDGITIDHGCTHDAPKLYVTKDGYDHLQAEGVSYTYIPRQPANIKMKGPDEIQKLYRSACMPVMDFYPTYEGYLEMMSAFENQYPDLCKLINIGSSVNNRELMILHIGDDLESMDDEPNFLYTSTMHGDETAGFPMMLQLIDHLLCNYDSDDRIRNLVDEVNIFINPLANPDGTYTSDNSTVQGATRRNANFIDLNRNYPDPKGGPNPDNRPTQVETQAFMDFASSYGIDISCNFHGGAELVQYPWDTWEKRHADDSWWFEKCTAYAESCHEHGPPNYMRDEDNGVTNGWDWYEVEGGRQDQMTYFMRGREITIELTGRKLVDSDLLPIYWEANREALIAYMEESLYGLRGIVKDCDTGMPISAKVLIEGHDIDNSSVFSDSLLGNYFRYLDDGEYLVSYIAEGYDTLAMPVVVMDKVSTIQDVELCKLMSGSIDVDIGELKVQVVGSELRVQGSENENQLKVELYTIDGRLLDAFLQQSRIDISYLQSGSYLARIGVDEEYVTTQFVVGK